MTMMLSISLGAFLPSIYLLELGICSYPPLFFKSKDFFFSFYEIGGILVPQPGIEPIHTAVKAESPTREVPFDHY